VDEVIMLCKRRVVFSNIFQRNIKDLASKFTNFSTLWATLMSVYLGKQWQHATALLLPWGLMVC